MSTETRINLVLIYCCLAAMAAAGVSHLVHTHRIFDAPVSQVEGE